MLKSQWLSLETVVKSETEEIASKHKKHSASEENNILC